MKKKFISLILAVTMFAPLISSFGISKIVEPVDATDYPDPTETVYELGTTRGTKYSIPQDSRTSNGGKSYKLGYNNKLLWQIYAPQDGDYAFSVGGAFAKGSVFSFTCSFIPNDTTKMTETFSVTNTVETDWTAIYCTEHVSLSKGQYTFELLQTSSKEIDVFRPFEDVLSTAHYTANYYLNNVFYSKKQFDGVIGNMTNVTACGNLTEYQQLPFSQVLIEEPYGLNIDVFYIDSLYPRIVMGSENFNCSFVSDANALFAFLPRKLNTIKMISPIQCELSINGTPLTLNQGIQYDIDISLNPLITYSCDTMGLNDIPFNIMDSGNQMDSLCFQLDKGLGAITKDPNTSATGSISLISGSQGTITVIDSDGDPSTSEVTEFLKRGSSSYDRPYGKYSYKFKLSKKYPLLTNKNGEQVSSKGWCLIANNTQEFTGLGNAVAQDLYQLMDGADALSYKFVNVYIGKVYQGVYQLIEKSDAQSKNHMTIVDDAVLTSDHKTKANDKNAKISADTVSLPNGAKYRFFTNVESSSDITGFVFEKTQVTSWPYHAKVISKNGIQFEIKEPNYPTENQVIRLANFIQDAEDAFLASNGINVKGKHYSDYLDIASMSNIFLTEMFYGNVDWMANSTYYTLDIDSFGAFTKIKSGSLWDMSTAPAYSNSFDTIYRWSTTQDRLDNYWKKGDFMAQMAIQNLKFVNALESEKSILDSKIASMSYSMSMNDTLYNHDFSSLASDFKKTYNYRVNGWAFAYTNNENAMKGVTISNKGKTLTAEVKGSCNSYQWYKVADDGYTGLAIDNATTSTYVATQPGKYYVEITGQPLSQTHYSSIPTTMISNLISVKYGSSSLVDTLVNASSGDIIVLDRNYNDVNADYTIKQDVTIDLNGYSITNGDSFTVNGQIVDTNSVKGIIEADGYSFGDEQKYLPIKDSSKGGYAFYDVSIEEQISGTNKLQFRMKKASSDSNAALDLIGNMDIALGYEVKACVTVDWKESDGAGGTIDKHEVVTFEDDWMSYVILGADGSVAPVKTYSRVFNFTINNLATLVADGKVKMQCSFVTYRNGEVLSSVEGLKWKTINGQTWFN